jgi:hypothetical protein
MASTIRQEAPSNEKKEARLTRGTAKSKAR